MAASNGELVEVSPDLERPVVAPGDDRLVNTFNFTTYDPSLRLGALMTMNSLPGDPTMWRQALLAFDTTGDLLLCRGFGRGEGAPVSANLSYECLEPFRRWRLRFDGFAHRVRPEQLVDAVADDSPEVPVRFDLEYQSIMPAWGHVSDGDVAGTHYEQNGLVRGWWQIGDARHEYDGVGFRDRIVGPKDTGLLRAHNWIHGTLPSGRAFALTVVTLKPDPERRLGSACVVAGGRMYAAEVVEMQMQSNLEEQPSELSVTLESELGTARLALEPLHTARWMYVTSPEVRLQPALFGHDRSRSDALLLWESAARVVWDGEIGYGHIERSLAT